VYGHFVREVVGNYGLAIGNFCERYWHFPTTVRPTSPTIIAVEQRTTERRTLMSMQGQTP
jgi:hypothetical protein